MGAVRPTNLSVSKIKSRLLNIAQSSLYRVTLVIPSAVKSKVGWANNQYNVDNISLLCCEAALPGSSLTTHEVNNDYHGVTEKMAYRRMYDETVGLTFYVDRDYKVIELLEGWMDYITGIDSNNIYASPYASYRMAYPKSYKENIYLTKFEKDAFVRDYSAIANTSSRPFRTSLDYTFVNAFPLSLTSMPVSYDGGQLLKCSVSFNFVRYITEKRRSISSFDASDFTQVEQREIPLNRDPTLGASDLLGTLRNFA